MLSVETETRICKLIIGVAEGENAADVTRQILADQIDFDAYSCFRKLDFDGKGFITDFDISSFLK